MKFSELKGKTLIELQEMLKEKQVKLGKCSFELASRILKDTSQLGKTRREIAKIITAIDQLLKLASPSN